MFSRPKILFLVSLLFVALLNSIPTYLLNFEFLQSFTEIHVVFYGTHQLQLKCDTRVPRVCRPRNAHALLLHACTFVCFYLLHHEYVRKHTRYVYMNTRFFIHAHTSHGVTCTQLHLYSLAN